MEAEILINEVHPNPESGSEWIELLCTNEETSQNFNLTNFTIFDNIHQIYKFNNESFTNQLLVVEVSGLNNDTDSIILKDTQGNVLDSFTYNKTEKGLSWSRDDINNTFILVAPSKNLKNPILTTTPTPTNTPTNIPTTSLAPMPTATTEPTATAIKSSTQEELEKYSTIDNKQIFQKYDLSQIKLNSHDREMQNRELRLVFLGEQLGQVELVNAIIGSFLVILSASFLLYVKIKNKHH